MQDKMESSWIKTKEQLPANNQKVIFLLAPKLEMRFGSFLAADQWGRPNMFCDGAFHDTEFVAYWHEVPPSPKE